jgi:hypothetical protein
VRCNCKIKGVRGASCNKKGVRGVSFNKKGVRGVSCNIKGVKGVSYNIGESALLLDSGDITVQKGTEADLKHF